MMVVGAGEAKRWLRQVLDQRRAITDDLVICLNRATKDEERMCLQYGAWVYSDDREWGREQPRIKTDLLRRCGRLRPDWILPGDADELFEERFTRKEVESLASTGDIGFYFYIINLWNDEGHMRRYLNFWNIRFFRYAPEYGLEFAKKNLHCGLAPPVAYYYGSHAPFYVKHYGLMRREDREAKIARYEQYDPKAIWKGREYYEALKDPGVGSPFVPEEMSRRVRNEVESYHEKPKRIESKIYV